MNKPRWGYLFSLLLVYNAGIGMAYAAGDAGGASAMDFVWKLVNFVVLVWLIYHFAKKPVGAAMQNSATAAKNEIDQARQAKEDMEQELKKFQEKLANMEQETESMVANAKKEAHLQKERIIAEGEALVAKIQEQARFTIEQEYKKAQHQLKEWVASEFILLAEEKIKQHLNPSHQQTLVQSYIKDIVSLGDTK